MSVRRRGETGQSGQTCWCECWSVTLKRALWPPTEADRFGKRAAAGDELGARRCRAGQARGARAGSWWWWWRARRRRGRVDQGEGEKANEADAVNYTRFPGVGGFGESELSRAGPKGAENTRVLRALYDRRRPHARSRSTYETASLSLAH